VGGPDAENWRRVSELAKILEECRRGPLIYRAADNLPFGKGWNTGMKDESLKSFGLWAAGLPGIAVAGTIEIPYANASGAEVNADSARAFGRDLARAIRRYLESMAHFTHGSRGPAHRSDQAVVRPLRVVTE
jgi:hypothetical protein